VRKEGVEEEERREERGTHPTDVEMGEGSEGATARAEGGSGG
jgi:hypothetical protein